MKEDPFLISGRNTIIHKQRKVDLLVVNSRQDPVLLVVHNGIEIYEGKVPENKLEAKRMDLTKVDIAHPDNFGDYKSLLFIQTLNNKEFKIDYSKKERSTSLPFIKKIHSKSQFLGHFLIGLLLLSSIFFFADYVAQLFALSLPPAVIGIVALFLILLYFRSVPKSISYAAKPLLAHMSLFFIPAIVPIIDYVDLIRAFPLALLMAVIITTIISLAISAWLSQKLMANKLLQYQQNVVAGKSNNSTVTNTPKNNRS